MGRLLCCEFEHLDYCCPPQYLLDIGFHCSQALLMKEKLVEKCGATDDDLMTEEEWEGVILNDKT